MTSSRGSEQLRLFVAVTLPPPAKDAVAGLIHAISGAGAAGVRAVAPEGAHLTLKFLGTVDAGRIPGLQAALSALGPAVAPFAVELRGVGGFPDLQAPRALWAGVSSGVDDLSALAHRVDEACAARGFPRERRPFSPHLTVARLRDSATTEDRRRAGAVLAAADYAGAAFTVDAFRLIKSTLTPSGPVYETLHRVPLGPGGS